MGVVHGRANQIVHARIENEELLRFAFFYINHARQKDAGIGGDEPSRLEYKIHIEPAGELGHDRAIGGRIGRWVLSEMVGHTEPAAEIGARDLVAVGAERANEFHGAREGRLEGFKLGDLASDVKIDADDFYARKIARHAVDF